MQTEDSKDTDSKPSADGGSRPAPDASTEGAAGDAAAAPTASETPETPATAETPAAPADKPSADDKVKSDQPAETKDEANAGEAPAAKEDEPPADDKAKSDQPAETKDEANAGEAPAAKEEAKPGLVVAVDDDAEFTASLRTYFEGKNLRVKTFASKAELAEWDWDQQPALFIVDQNLAGEDGRSVALDAQEQGKLRNCPIVLLTDTEMDRETKAFSLKLGFRRIVKKPVQFEALERIITDEVRQTGADAKKAEGGDKEADQKAFEERKAAVLKKMGLDETQTAEEALEAAGARGAESAPATKRVSPNTARVATGPATAKVKTAVVGVAGEPAGMAAKAGLAAKKEQESCWLKGMAFGMLMPAAAAVPFAFIPWGYTNPVVMLEGALMGTLAGVGLSRGLRRLPVLPAGAAVIAAAVLITLVPWGLLLGLRVVLDMPFVVYTEAARQHIHDPGRTWGLSEYTAVAYISAHWILSVAAAIFFIRRTLRALAVEQSKAATRALK